MKSSFCLGIRPFQLVLILVSIFFLIYFIVHTALHFSLQDLKQQNAAVVITDDHDHDTTRDEKEDHQNSSFNNNKEKDTSPHQQKPKSRNAAAVDTHSKKNKFQNNNNNSSSSTTTSTPKKKQQHKTQQQILRQLQLDAMNDFIKRSKDRGRRIWNGEEHVGHFIADEERRRDNAEGGGAGDGVGHYYRGKAMQIEVRADTDAAKEAMDWSEYHRVNNNMVHNNENLARELERLDPRAARRRPYEPLVPEICSATEGRMRSIANFTREKVDKRPDYAILTLIAKKHGTADNSTRRSVMAKYSFLNKFMYAREHGYDLIVEGDDAVDHSRAPAWSKIRALRRWLPLYEHILYIDMDTIIVDFKTKIEDIVIEKMKQFRKREQKHFEDDSKPNMVEQDGKKVPSFQRQVDIILTSDWNGINSGVMFVRKSDWTLEFLKKVWSVPQRYANPYWDQGGILFLIGLHRLHTAYDSNKAKENLSHLWIYDFDPRSFFNSYPANFIQHEENIANSAFVDGKNFVCHFPSCRHFTTFCIPWFIKFFNKSLCNNDGTLNGPKNYEPPDHYYPPEEELPTLPPLFEPLEDLSHSIDFEQRIGGGVDRLGGIKIKSEDSPEDFARRARKERAWKRAHGKPSYEE